MQGYVVAQIARQINGEGEAALADYVGAVIYRVFKDKEKAHAFSTNLAADTAKKGEQMILTPEGPVRCLLGPIGVHPVEIEE